MAVAACRHPPVGMRSNGPVRAVHYGGGDYVASANDEIVIMAMIETKEGLANLDAICATPGLDAVYIGLADLSFALGPAGRSGRSGRDVGQWVEQTGGRPCQSSTFRSIPSIEIIPAGRGPAPRTD